MDSCDMSARLAAIKDIPTQRLIELAVAEAAGRISILPSAAERAHQDNQPNEPLTLEELKEMAHQPVWVECQYFIGWAILHIAWPEIYVAAADGNTYFIWTNGKYNERLGAKLYRRPPKEET